MDPNQNLVMLLLAAFLLMLMLSTAYSIIMYPPWRLSRDTLWHIWYVEISLSCYVSLTTKDMTPDHVSVSQVGNLFVACLTSSALNQRNGRAINGSLLYSPLSTLSSSSLALASSIAVLPSNFHIHYHNYKITTNIYCRKVYSLYLISLLTTQIGSGT